MSESDIPYRGITELGRAYRTGETGPVAVTTLLLDRIDKLNPHLHAFIGITRERALAGAKAAEAQLKGGLDLGPLHGIPYVAKDLFNVRGQPTTAGTRLLEDNIATGDCTAVTRLDAAGMVLLGKTHIVQFALGIIGVNHDQGTPHNPWHETPHIPGGSSSGSAVAVSSGLAPVALGSDTGGSVRAPAALCGVVGLKTTIGRISRHGIYPLSWSLDSPGTLARTVEDAALVYHALRGPDPGDRATLGVALDDVLRGLNGGVRGLRIAFGGAPFFDDLDADVEAAVREAGKVFEAAGAQLGTVDIPEVAQIFGDSDFRSVVLGEAVAINRELLENHPDQLDPVVRDLLERGQGMSAAMHAAGLHKLAALQAGIADTLRDVDAVIVPTTKQPARPIEVVDASLDSYRAFYPAYMGNTMPGNYLDLPGVSLPCGFSSEGLPIGLQVMAKPFQEHMALRVAQAYERETDWHTQRPALNWAD
ncbi:MAG: amidase [Rhodospirillales bacterium]|jgi:aspartyl-tRNA(Asn)/glutamyl-tRNA(Gln) amidotransferase subunit A|nr:amidase [Rhodospirillales bacterium]